MKKYNMILTEKQQKYQLYRLEILPSGESRIIKQEKFAYSPLGKAFEKQMKTIEGQGKKQIDAISNQIKGQRF